MATGKAIYNVTYERDAKGFWVASVDEVPGCHTQGRSIQQASRRIVEALGLFIAPKKLAKAELRHRKNLVPEIEAALLAVRTAKQDVCEAEARARARSREAARLLTKRYRLSFRDAGDLLELSHQRVQQLVDG